MSGARVSFRARVAIWSVCVSGLALLMFFTASSVWMRHEFLEIVETNASSIASVVAVAMESGSLDVNKELSDNNESKYKVAAVMDKQGRLLFAESSLWEDETAAALKAGGYAFSPDGLWKIRLFERSRYHVFIASNLAETEGEYLEVVWSYVMGLPLALVLAAWGGWWLGGKAARPIRAIAEAVSQVSPGDLNIRVPGSERFDEIGELARLTNGMLERVEKGYVQARRFTGDASHELRTPLAILQSELEQRIREADAAGEDQESNGRMLDEVRRLKALTNALLFLARVDAGTLELAKEAVPLGEVLDEIVDELGSERFGEALAWEVAGAEGVVLNGEPNLLRQLLRNLLRNAALYNREGGRVGCSVSVEEGEARIVIGNTGNAILETSRERLFDRFFRCESERSRRRDGFGLGLNISQAIAREHGGEILLLPAKEDWTEFEVRLPLGS